MLRFKYKYYGKGLWIKFKDKYYDLILWVKLKANV